ncbi:hypothetical protein PR048_029333 [Dryococelus australis]|uniref:C2H2-type domain-containing protein n=1 Tax=Dryococelus australis TaxID=614101 RepID=A0ABQ9GFP7_9NEOP|nr:hypothetical protein PR048_029333 [Dryococelus australis]
MHKAKSNIPPSQRTLDRNQCKTSYVTPLDGCINSLKDSNVDTKVAVKDRFIVIKPSFICGACNKCFISQCSLYKSRSVEETNFLCTICMTQHMNENVFCEHLKSHENRYVTCQLCKDKLQCVNIVCSVCKSTFDNEELYKNHQKTHTSQEKEDSNKLSCQVCKRNFVSKTLLEIHERLHTEELFKCNRCGGQFWTQQILVEHQDVCGATETCSWFKCSLCQENFRTHGVMVEHMRHCTDSLSLFFYCEVCLGLSPCADNLVAHRLMHLKGKSKKVLPCNCCGTQFFSASGLAAHKYCTGKIAYSCSPCNVQFLLESSFVLHVNKRHLIKTSLSGDNNKQMGSIVVENIGTDDKKKGNAVSFQIVSPHINTQNNQLPDTQVEICSSPFPSLEKIISDQCIQQNNLLSDQKSVVISKRICDKMTCFDEISPNKKLCKIFQNTNFEQNITCEDLFSSVSIITENNTPSHSVPLESEKNTSDDVSVVLLENNCFQIQMNAQQPRIASGSTVKTVQHNSEESVNIKTVPCNKTVAIKPTLLLQALNSPPYNDDLQQGRVTVEKMGVDDKSSNKGDVPQIPVKTFEVMPHHITSQNFQKPSVQGEKSVRNQSSSPSLLVESAISEQNNSPSCQKSFLMSKRISDKTNLPDEISPTKKLCKISSLSTTTHEQTNKNKRVSSVSDITENCTQSSHSGSLESGICNSNNIIPALSKNHCSKLNPNVQKSQSVSPTSSPQKLNRHTKFARVLPMRAIANIQPMSSVLVRNNHSEETVNFKIIPINRTAGVNHRKLQTLITAGSQSEQSASSNLSKIGPDNTPTKIQPNSEVLHVVNYKIPQMTQKSSPSFMTLPAKRIASFQPSSQLVKIVNPQTMQTICVPSTRISESKPMPSIQPGSSVLQQRSSTNKESKQSNNTVFPVKLQNSVANVQPNTPIPQKVNIATPQTNQNSGHIFKLVPTNSITKRSSSDKRLLKGNVATDIGVEASTLQPKASPDVSYCREILPQSTPKIGLLPVGNSNTLRSLPVAAVQALPLANKAKALPVVQTNSVNNIIPATVPAKNSVLNVVLPIRSIASKVTAVPASSCENNASQPAFEKVFVNPGNSRLQNDMQEILVEVEDLFESDLDINSADQLTNEHRTYHIKVESEQDLVFHRHKSQMLEKLASFKCKLCGNYFADNFQCRMHKLSCSKLSKIEVATK